MNSSGNNENFEGSTSRPFFYVPLMAQQPHLGPWYQNPAYNPLSIPGAGGESESPRRFSGIRDPPCKSKPEGFLTPLSITSLHPVFTQKRLAAHGAVFVVQVKRKYANSSFVPVILLNSRNGFSHLTSTHELGIVAALAPQMREPNRGSQSEIGSGSQSNPAKVSLGCETNLVGRGTLQVLVSILLLMRPKHSNGEGNDTPLQYSCLENPIDGGPW